MIIIHLIIVAALAIITGCLLGWIAADIHDVWLGRKVGVKPNWRYWLLFTSRVIVAIMMAVITVRTFLNA